MNRNERALIARRHKGLRFIGHPAFFIGAIGASIGLHGAITVPLLLIGVIFTWRASYWQGWLDATRADS